jgi:hypothetical protein
MIGPFIIEFCQQSYPHRGQYSSIDCGPQRAGCLLSQRILPSYRLSRGSE